MKSACLFAVFALFSFSAYLACANGDDGDPSIASPASDASIERRPAAPMLGSAPTPAPTSQRILDAACNVVVTAETVAPTAHVQEGSSISYATNPPSSGNHYPSWANFQEFPQPVPDGYLVHSLEHGAVLLLFKCAAPGTAECTDMLASLRKVRDETPTDPGCDPAIRVRVILAPRPELDVPIAASAWGFTYKADCFDGPSIAQFVRDHYAHAPEDFCFAGITSF